MLILLLMNNGKTYQQISSFLDIAYPTVAYWAVHSEPDKLESILDGRREDLPKKGISAVDLIK